LALRILLDASILIASLRLGMDPFKKIEDLILRRVDFTVTRSTLEELERLKGRGKGSSRISSLVLELLKEKRCRIISDEDYKAEKIPVDEILLRTARRDRMAIATMDESLRREARRLRIPVISMRGNRFYCDPPDPELWDIP
jgi:rRNA-processing protein FCF1